MQLGGSITSTILRTATAGRPTTHSFDGRARLVADSRETRSATGLGDILLRAKHLVRQNAVALAASLDLRLPTGDKDDLLGTGATQTKLQFIASGEYGLFAPHARLGYTFSDGDVGDLTSEVESILACGLRHGHSSRATAVDASMPDEIDYDFGSRGAPSAGDGRIRLFGARCAMSFVETQRQRLYRLGLRLADAVVVQSSNQVALAVKAFPKMRQVVQIPSFAEEPSLSEVSRRPEVFGLGGTPCGGETAVALRRARSGDSGGSVSARPAPIGGSPGRGETCSRSCRRRPSGSRIST